MKKLYPFSFHRKRRTINFKSIVSAAVLLLGGKELAYAQVSSYTFSQSSGTYAPITGTVLDTATGNTSTTNLNSNIYPLSLPFGFVFNGVSYNSLNVSTNGFITFGSTAPSTTYTTPVSGTTAYEGAVSVFGKDISSFFDISGATGDISWETTGTAPNREIVIQWKNFRPNSSTSTTAVYTFSFQIRLKETSNVIEMVYNNGSYLAGSTSVSGTAQIGLRGASATDFNTRLNGTSLEFVNSTPGTANSSTQAFNTVNAIPGMPSAGLTYTWTPPTCFAPSGITGGTTTNNSVNISWTPHVTMPSGYDVYYSTASTPPTSATTPTHQNVPGNSVQIGSLAPSTTYYVWVRANCGGGNTSVWSLQPVQISTQCTPPALTSTTGATTCTTGSATLTLTATADAGATVKWYDAQTGGNQVGTGNTFTTPAISSTTNYWAAAANTGNVTNVGPASPAGVGTNSAESTNWDLLFTVRTNIALNSVDIFPGTVGQDGVIEILTSSGTSLASIPFTTTVAGNSTAQTVPLNISLPPGTYAMRRTGTAKLYRNNGGAVFPYSTPELVITGTTFSSYPTYYFYFYNLNFTPTCESARTMVTAEISCMSTSETQTKETVKVHPNPFSDYVNISRPELVKSIKVTDVTGKLIRTIPNPDAALMLNDLSHGMYILILEMKDGSLEQKKVIKK
ncbi:T9SS C-terminal target domain-containing protein [Chryseobacterium arthrosphaerae]|uniref:Ig-like domain-containing protein n=1 Tax=Chryseobacterium arthrosphaerae TaxID=651561 RepID=UPI000F50E297|nr:T9SS type A sorting domain-containing protein [Chryseobacterium arthrosphaerae]AYZ14150.1 T9SS C-terminal target domain-containing protein [Chryseobacterium arthrosphaerae]